MIKKYIFLFLLLFSSLFISCKNETENRLYLNKNWQYSTEGTSGPFYDISIRDFSRLASKVENKKGYIWLKCNFTIPEELQNQTLTCYLGVTKVADKVFINDKYVGKSGFFPPKEFTSGEISSAYTISPYILNYDSDNEIIITLWVNGIGSVSSVPFLGTENDIYVYKTANDFLNSNIFLLLSAVLVVISFIYFFLYMFSPLDRSHLSFSRVTFFSAFYLATVCLGEYAIVFQGKYSYLIFEKIFNGIMGIVTANYAVSFIRDFLGHKDTKRATIFRKINVYLSILLVCIPGDLKHFYDILYVTYTLVAIHIGYAVLLIFRSIKEKNKKVGIMLIGFTPVLSSIVFSIIFMLITNKFVILIIVVGWQLTILSFLTILIHNFSKTQSDFEYLNKNLEKLIAERTQELKQTNIKLAETNTKLNYEKARTEKEILLAATVQKNFFSAEVPIDSDWEIALYSKALAGVSGDLYDFYFTNKNKLAGLGIFDVSGHGIASGLVTMLVKNIITQEFEKGKNKKLSEIVGHINNRVLKEKGNIENYLTGILCRLEKNSIELVNAGHPFPLFYNASTKEINNLDNHSQTRCGVIGISGLPAVYESFSLEITSGDEILFFTDGITEANNENKIAFGKKGLLDSFTKNISKDINAQIESLIEDLHDFVGNEKINDDVSILILRRK